MPLPIPFHLRTNQTSALTHAQLDGNLSILSTKIDNTTCSNIGTGVGIFESKQIGANDGIINLYSLSGANGINVSVSGNTLVVDGSGVNDSDWLSNGNDIYNANSGNVGIGTSSPGGLLELYSPNNDTSISNLLRFRNNDTVAGGGGGFEQFIGLIDFYGNENQGDGIRAYMGTVQDGNAQTSIIFGTTDESTGITINPTAVNGFPNEAMRVDPNGRIVIGIGQINDIRAKLHVNNITTEPSFIVEDSVNPDATPFVISSGGSVSIGISEPTEKLHVSGGDFLVETSNGKFYTDLDKSSGPGTILSGNSLDLISHGVTAGIGDSGMSFGTRGYNEPSFPGYGNQGDGFIYSSAEQNGLNVISQEGTIKEDYIRFYAGKDAEGTIPDIHIHGTGTTKGFVGINTLNPRERLHISGNTLSEGDIKIPDNHKLRIGDSSDLQIYHDGLNTYIGEVGTGNLLLSGTELVLNDSTTGLPFLKGDSALSNVKLYWGGDSRITTSEDGLVLDKTMSGTPIANLSIRADGTIITGSTVPEGLSTTVVSNADPFIPGGINTIFYTTTSPGGQITIPDSSTVPKGYQVKLIRTSTIAAATLAGGGTSTINGSASKALPTSVYSITTCVANGGDWYCSTGTVL